MSKQKQTYVIPLCEEFAFLPEGIVASSDPTLDNPGDYGNGGDPFAVMGETFSIL